MDKGMGEGRWTGDVTEVQQDKRDHGGSEEDEQGSGTAVRNRPEHESPGGNEQPCQRPLGSDSEGDGDAEQGDAFPVPENDFARGVEGVSGGNGGEDEAEGSTGSKDLGSGERRA